MSFFAVKKQLIAVWDIIFRHWWLLFKDQAQNQISNSLLYILHLKTFNKALNLIVLLVLISGGMYIILINE